MNLNLGCNNLAWFEMPSVLEGHNPLTVIVLLINTGKGYEFRGVFDCVTNIVVRKHEIGMMRH